MILISTYMYTNGHDLNENKVISRYVTNIRYWQYCNMIRYKGRDDERSSYTYRRQLKIKMIALKL